MINFNLKEGVMEADWCNLPIDLWSIIGHKLDVGVDRIRFRSVSNSLRSSLSFPQPPWLVLSESDQVGLEPHEYLSEEEEELGDDDEVVVPEVQEEELVAREVEVGYEQRQDKGINRNDELMVMDQEVKNAIPIPHRGIVDIRGGEQQIFDFDLPEAYRKRFIGSTGTWLLTADTHKAIHLLNPFSKLQVELPSMSTFNFDERITTPKDYRDLFITKAIISAPPMSEDCVAMALYLGSRLAIAKVGDTSWINVETPLPNIVDMIFYNERFYVVNYRGAVMVCDIGDNLHSPTASVLMDQSQFQKLGIELTTAENFYLVEWMGELLLVIRFLDITEVYNMYEAEEKEKTYIKSEDKPWYITYNFKVYQLDSSNRKWEELKSLGDYSLFLGMNASTSMLASDCVGRVKKNCIYFTDDSLCFSETNSAGGHDMGVFDMENNIIQPHYHGVSTSEFSPPIWVIPTILAKKSVSKLHMKKPSTIARLEYSSFGPKNTYCAQHDTDH